MGYTRFCLGEWAVAVYGTAMAAGPGAVSRALQQEGLVGFRYAD